MQGAFIGSRDYGSGSRDFNGFGTATPDELLELRKALSAGQDVNNPGTAPGVGFPLRIESLEATLKNQSFEMDEIKLFKAIPKVPAGNTVEEFNRLLSYSRGGAQTFDLGFMTEGDLPEEEDSTYERVTVLIKFLGIVGRVTHVMNVIRPAHGNAIALETQNKTMMLLQQLEHSLFFGDSSTLPQQWDGLQRLITLGASQNVIDLRGGPITEEVFADAQLRVRDGLGLATDFYSGTGPFNDFQKLVLDRQRFPAAPAPGVIGAQVTAFQGQHGRVALHDSIFIQPGGLAAAGGAGNTSKRPSAPTVAAPTAGATAGSLFLAADAGTYIYKVVAGSRYGRSAPTTSAGVAVVAGDAVSILITDAGPGSSYYDIYRTGPGGAAATAKYITRIARSGASQTFVDANADLPGLSTAFMLQQNSRSFAWSQLLPFTRLPLAAIDTSIRWAQVLYGAIKMYSPQRNVVLKNVGRMPGAV